MLKKLKDISDYSQPDFYHFSEDSITLAKYAATDFQNGSKDIIGLDICAGCGVVGLEFLQTFGHLSQFDFVEIQPHFEKSFLANVKYLFPQEQYLPFEFINKSFKEMDQHHFKKRYHLILSNPPYFDIFQCRLGKDQNRNRCRFFMDGSFEEFLNIIKFALKPLGSAYFLIREQKRIEQTRLHLGHFGSLSFKKIGKVTWICRFQQKPSIIVVEE